MNFYDYIYETFDKFPYEFLTSLDRPGFCTVLCNKTIVSKEYFTFGMHPEDSEYMNEWCSTSDINKKTISAPDNLIDNSLYSISLTLSTKKYCKIFIDDECFCFEKDGILVFHVANSNNKYHDIPKTKDEWFNMTVLEPNFKLQYEELVTIQKIIDNTPSNVSFELYPDSWAYKKDLDK